jgi:hypothetical protein
MARTLIIGPVVGIGLGLWATGGAAVPAEARRVVVDPNAAHRPGSAGGDRVLTPPALTDVVAPLVLAALCGTAAAFFSARPRPAMRPRVARRRTRG